MLVCYLVLLVVDCGFGIQFCGWSKLSIPHSALGCLGYSVDVFMGFVVDQQYSFDDFGCLDLDANRGLVLRSDGVFDEWRVDVSNCVYDFHATANCGCNFETEPWPTGNCRSSDIDFDDLFCNWIEPCLIKNA